MKIPEYISKSPSDMVYCSAAINREYMVLMGDEHFYRFMGKTVGISMLDCVHPELRQEFQQACGSLEQGGSARILTAMRGMDEGYRQVDMAIRDCGHTVNGEPV